MRLLIIGQIVSQYVNNFAIALREFRNDISIDIINDYPIPNKQLIHASKGIYDRVFNEQPLFGFIEKIPKLRGLIRYFYSRRALKEVEKNIHSYDVVLLHGFWQRNCLIFKKINTQKKFSLGVIWGSDFYKRGKNEALMFSTMDLCDRISISTSGMIYDVLC